MSEIERDGFSAREMYLMRQAHEAGRCAGEGETLDTWLDETISDAGHYVAQHLAHDAERLYGEAMPKCDGNHCGPPCRDRDCWNDEGRVARAQQAVRSQAVAVGDPLPCPFCGSSDVGGAMGVVSCYRCPAEVSVQNANTGYAVELWNNRAPQPAQQGSVPEGWRSVIQDTINELSIMDDSEGITGWHLNGAVATWDESGLPAIRDALCELLSATPQPEGDGWLGEVAAERRRQDQKWGGPEHDDQKSPNDFVQHIEDYAGWARVMAGMGSFDKYRRRMIQVAALAGAAVEAVDRALARANPPAEGAE